jgi:hypothetical protein
MQKLKMLTNCMEANGKSSNIMRNLKVYTAEERMPKNCEKIIVWGTIGIGNEKEIPEPWFDEVTIRDDNKEFPWLLERDCVPFDGTLKYSLASDVMDIIKGD